MPAVVPIRFKYNPKTYWFEYGDCNPKVGDFVLVARDGGKVFGWVEDEPFVISNEQAGELKSPLKSILRIANDDDLEKKQKLEEKGLEAKEVFRELARKRELDIKPIDVEYLLDTDKAIFHFSSEERVDFRELVRDLAARLHVHVDMKQIGVRDEARIIGGLGHCGEVLCCVRMSDAFQPVSIRMAKEQDLPLNPTKVSGACGRLMCCLRYEFDAYKDFKSRAPKLGGKVSTPKGEAKVVELNGPKELVKLKIEDEEESFTVPLACLEMDPENTQNNRPSILGEDAYEEYCPSANASEKTFQIPVEEILEEENSKSGKRRRKKSNSGRSESGRAGASKAEKVSERQQGRAASDQDSDSPEESKSRRHRSRRRRGAAQQDQGQTQRQQGQQVQGQRQRPSSDQANSGEDTGRAGSEPRQRRRQRPGQNSSNIQNPQDSEYSKGRQQGRQQRSGQQPRRRMNAQDSGQASSEEQARVSGQAHASGQAQGSNQNGQSGDKPRGSGNNRRRRKPNNSQQGAHGSSQSKGSQQKGAQPKQRGGNSQKGEAKSQGGRQQGAERQHRGDYNRRPRRTSGGGHQGGSRSNGENGGQSRGQSGHESQQGN